MAPRSKSTPASGPIITADNLRNAMTGLGGDADKLTSTNFVFTEMNQQQLDAAYRSDWITRKGIDIPAFDATREWRSWQADPKDVTKIEDCEKQFSIQQKVMRAIQCARLYGGGALLLGVEDGGDASKELVLDKVKQGSLKFVHSLSRFDIAEAQPVQDIMSPFYGRPEYYTRNGVLSQASMKIHPSRVIVLNGPSVLDRATRGNCWGDSVLQSVNEAVLGSGLVTNSVAQLVAETKIDIIKIPGLSKNIATKAYENDLKARFSFANVAKSIYRTLVMDKEEEWQRVQANFAGLPDVQRLFLLIVSGAFDIPATRFLGQSPVGMSATGESDTRNYYDRCSSIQKNEIQPELKTLDEVLLRNALGSLPKGETTSEQLTFYTWNPLWQLSDTEKAALWKQKADIAKIDYDMGLVNEVVLKKARESQLIEDGVYPGLEQLIEDFDDDPDLEEKRAQEEENAKNAAAALAIAGENSNNEPGDVPNSPSPKSPEALPPSPTKDSGRAPHSASDADDGMTHRVRDYNKNHHPAGTAGGKGGEFAPNTAPAITEEEFNNLSPDWDSVTDKKRKRLMHNSTENWFGTGYEDVNAALRVEGEETWYYGKHQQEIRGLDRAFENLGKKVPRDMTMYRGVSGDVSDKFTEGAIFEDKGFNSVTPDKSIAESFGTSKGVVLHVEIKKDTVVYKPELDPKMAEDPDMISVEPEILLRRGSRYRVKKRTGKNVYVELL